MRSLRTVTLILAILAVLFSAQSGSVHAEHTEYRFKWPYRPGVFAPTTTLPGEGGHADAWDFDIDGAGVNGEVVSSAEGTVVSVTSGFDPNTCNPADGNGFGNHVKVLVPVPDPEPDITVTYAHLTSASVAEPNRVLQGDQIGIEGKTGHTHDSEPPGYPPGSNNCGTHLHFQFNPARPSYMDGLYVGGSPPPGGDSTNSIVGAYNDPGAAIKQRYRDLGDIGYGPSWGVVGWTADRTGSQQGCVDFPFCRLYVHYSPTPDGPDAGHWGSKQDFRQHPDPGIGFEFSSIMVGRWAVNDAYWVQKGFFGNWYASGQDIGLAITEQLSTNPYYFCFPALGCERYQRFHVGYMWEHETQGIQPAEFCPDVASPVPGQAYDYQVDLVNDVFAVAGRFDESDPGPNPYDPWPDAWYDIDGSGRIDLFNDVMAVANAFDTRCYPE